MSNAYSYRTVEFASVETWARDDPAFETLDVSIPGVNGELTIRMGTRGGNMSIEGFISQENPDAFFATVRSLIDGVLGTFTPGHGSSIDNVRCEGIQSLGFFSYTDGYRERYRVTFRVMR